MAVIKKTKAFTLIELLVVISVIALMMAILMPALSKARKLARQTICGTRVKQIIYGAVLAANDNNGRLPRGGYNFGNQNFDDAIQFRAEEFLNLCSYLIGTSSSVNININMPQEELEVIARRVFDGKASKNFVCPELEKFEYERSDLLFKNQTKTNLPYIHVRKDGWTTRLGYCYLGGFDTDKWDWNTYPKTVEKWRSPMTISDSGDSPLVTDRYRYVQGSSVFVTVHGRNGPENIPIRVRDADEITDKFPSLKSNVGRLDGSVLNSRFNDLKAHHVTMENNKPRGRLGYDYYYW
jgi:prepilin-type N-terminal cleavage/methylation domain-containing protein